MLEVTGTRGGEERQESQRLNEEGRSVARELERLAVVERRLSQ